MYAYLFFDSEFGWIFGIINFVFNTIATISDYLKYKSTNEIKTLF